MADEEVEVDNDESVIYEAEQYRVIGIRRRRQIHIMERGCKRRVLKQTETLKKRNDEVKFLDYFYHHFQSVFIATLCLLFLVMVNISILDQFFESNCVSINDYSC